MAIQVLIFNVHQNNNLAKGNFLLLCQTHYVINFRLLALFLFNLNKKFKIFESVLNFIALDFLLINLTQRRLHQIKFLKNSLLYNSNLRVFCVKRTVFSYYNKAVIIARVLNINFKLSVLYLTVDWCKCMNLFAVFCFFREYWYGMMLVIVWKKTNFAFYFLPDDDW